VESGAGCSSGKGRDGFTSQGFHNTGFDVDAVILQFA
jgi:hypothetical protein